MSKIQIDLPENITKKLKILALQSDRSLSKFIPLYLAEAINKNLITVDEATGNILSTTNTTISTSNSSDLSNSSEQDQMIADIVKSGGIVRMPKLSKTQAEDKAFHEKIETQTHLEREHNLYTIFDEFKVDEYDDTKLTLISNGIIYNLITNDYDKTHTLTEITNYMKELHDKYYSENDDYEEPEKELYKYQTEIEKREKKLKIKNSTIYKLIKKYCINNNLGEALYCLVEYPGTTADDVDLYNSRYDNFIYKALGSPTDGSYQYSPEEWQEIADSFVWEE